MLQVKKIEKKYKVDRYRIVKFQIFMDLVFFKNEEIISSDVEILTLLCLWGEMELKKFCVRVVKQMYSDNDLEKFNTRSQNVRNKIEKMCKRGFIVKLGNNKKSIKLSESIVIESEGNVLLNYNLLSIESE